MSAPRKGSICVEDSETGIKSSKIIHPRSIQRLFEGKRVHDVDPSIFPTVTSSTQEQLQPLSLPTPAGSQVKVTDFAFRSLRRNNKPRHVGRTGSVAPSGGIAFNFKSVGSDLHNSSSSTHDSDSSPIMRRRSNASREIGTFLPSDNLSGVGRNRRNSESETAPNKHKEEKQKVSWSKAYAAAAAFANGKVGDVAKSEGVSPPPSTPTLPRAMSGGSLSGTTTASAVDWRFHKQSSQPVFEVKMKKVEKVGEGLKGSHSYSSNDVLNGRSLSSALRTLTPDSVGGVGLSKDKAQPLFSDKEMEKMYVILIFSATAFINVCCDVY